MDFAKIKPSERIVDILHPESGEKTGVSVQLISLRDEKLAAVRRRIQNKNIEFQKRGKTLKAADIEENEMELLVACITGWNWGDNLYNGEVPQFCEKNVRDILNDLPWFKQQIVEAIDDEKAFFQS